MEVVVGADVSKRFTTYTLLSSKGVLLKKSFNLSNDSKGLFQLLDLIKKVTNNSYDKTIIIMESTGYFSNRLRDFFTSHQVKVMEINPLVSNSIRNASIRKVKSDYTDSFDLANLYITSLSNMNLASKIRIYEPASRELDCLRVLTRNRLKLSEEYSCLKLKVLSEIAQIFPGYDKVFTDLFCKSSICILSLLLKGSPLSKEKVKKHLKKITPNRGEDYFKEKYEQIKYCSNETALTGRNIPAFHISIEIHLNIINSYIVALKKLDDEISKLANEIPACRLLQTIPGIGLLSASALLGEIQDISKFSNSKKLVAYCGIDPSVKQSGQYQKIHNSISKRGSPYLRNVLYKVALVSIIKTRNEKYINKTIYDLYHKKKATKPGKVALGAVMNKLVRIIYSVLKNEKEYIEITAQQQKELYISNLKVIA